MAERVYFIYIVDLHYVNINLNYLLNIMVFINN